MSAEILEACGELALALVCRGPSYRNAFTWAGETLEVMSWAEVSDRRDRRPAPRRSIGCMVFCSVEDLARGRALKEWIKAG